MKRSWTLLLAGASLLIAGDLAVAAGAGQGKGPPDNRGGQQAKKAHKHEHKNGHNLLGAKLKQNGKHDVGKLANRTVTAEVKNGKVASMAAGDLPMKRVKSKTKMAAVEGGVIPIAWSGAGNAAQLIQYTDDYYGYCFENEYDIFTCYWYPASDVDYVDYTWEDYDPYY